MGERLKGDSILLVHGDELIRMAPTEYDLEDIQQDLVAAIRSSWAGRGSHPMTHDDGSWFVAKP